MLRLVPITAIIMAVLILFSACGGDEVVITSATSPSITPSVAVISTSTSATPAPTPTLTPAPITTTSMYLVMIVIDAGKPDYWDISQIPNIKNLMSEGMTYTNAWVGQLRNDTPPGHATISTGALPKNTGIIGFTWRDPKSGQLVRPSSWNNVLAGGYNQTIANSGCSSIAAVYKTAYPGTKAATFSSDKWYAAAALGANKSADFIGYCKYDVPTRLGTDVGYTLEPIQVAGGLTPEPEIINSPDLKRKVVNYYDGDTWTTDFALKYFEKEKPEIMLINLSLTDNYGHKYGGMDNTQKMKEVTDNVDRQIGRIIEAYQNAGIYDKTIFVVTSDHGMSPNRYTLDEGKMSQIKIDYEIEGAGSRVEYYIKDSSRAKEAAEKVAQLGLNGVNGVYYKEKDASGNYYYLPAPTTLSAIDPGVDACYRYLTSTYASAVSADFVLFPGEGWNTKDATAYYKGDHGTTTYQNQRIPLVICGPGIKHGKTSNAPARLVDIAPTVLTAMGLQPVKMDGVVLADALVSPGIDLVNVQNAKNEELNPLLDALKQQSDIDLKKK